MRSRPYLRAYMAGIVVPTLVLLAIASIDAYHVFYLEVPSQFVFGPAVAAARGAAILFPMAVVAEPVGRLEHGLGQDEVAQRRLPIGVTRLALLVALIVPAGHSSSERATRAVFAFRCGTRCPRFRSG
mgnify:CR=1 FL=1